MADRQLSIELSKLRDTTHQTRFAAPNQPVNTLYVQQDALARIGSPERVRVIVEAA